MEEARRAGTTLPDQLQQAILLRCVTGQLRTHLNLATQDTTTFKDLREHVLRWDRGQQKWSGLIFGDDSSTAVPMEVDRLYSGGKKGAKDGKGKGSFQKGSQKGKSRGKSKSKPDGKSNGKGKQKGESKGKYGGKQNDGNYSKGKGGSRTDLCHKCGKPGHFARDCWAQVRNVQGDFQQQSQQQQPQGSPSSTSYVGGSTVSSGSQPHVNTQPSSSATQFRVARIHEFADVQLDSDVQKHDEAIFDLRSYASSPGHRDGVVRTVRFYIGDDPSDAPNGSVRAIVEDMPTGSDMCNILIDNGADASIFPSTMSGFGVDSTQASNR